MTPFLRDQEPALKVRTQPVTIPMGPTMPEVPMPEEIGGPFCLSLKTTVAMGPLTIEATTAGNHSTGFLSKLGTCNIEFTQTLRR